MTWSDNNKQRGIIVATSRRNRRRKVSKEVEVQRCSVIEFSEKQAGEARERESERAIEAQLTELWKGARIESVTNRAVESSRKLVSHLALC